MREDWRQDQRRSHWQHSNPMKGNQRQGVVELLVDRPPVQTPYGPFVDGWRVINLDKREVIIITDPPVPKDDLHMHSPGHDGQAVESSRSMIGAKRDGISAFLCSILEPEMIPYEQLPKPAKNRNENKAPAPDGGVMAGLPDDILLHIFDKIDSFRDATNLCLTNSRVLLVGLRRVEQLCRRTLAPWSGDRVIAVRATFKLSLPDPVTGLTRQQELYPNLVEPDVLRPRGDLFAHFEMQEPDRPAGLLKGFTQLNPTSDPSSFCHPGFQWHRFGGMFLHNYPEDVTWVICNLTKREYAIAQDAEGCSSKNKTLDIRRNRQFASKLRCTENWDVTMQKVCWSMTIRGTWAGDRISIVALSQAQSRYTDWSQWKEVTVTRRCLDTGVAT